MKIFTQLLIALFLSMGAFAAYAELAVIVHPTNAATLSKDDISRIFLGKNRSFPGGGEAVPVSFTFGSAESEEFSKSVLGKTPKQLKAYWAKMIFTGQGTPPKELDGAAQIIDLVSKNPSLIGFVPSGSVNASVKAVGKY